MAEFIVHTFCEGAPVTITDAHPATACHVLDHDAAFVSETGLVVRQETMLVITDAL